MAKKQFTDGDGKPIRVGYKVWWRCSNILVDPIEAKILYLKRARNCDLATIKIDADKVIVNAPKITIALTQDIHIDKPL